MRELSAGHKTAALALALLVSAIEDGAEPDTEVSGIHFTYKIFCQARTSFFGSNGVRTANNV